MVGQREQRVLVGGADVGQPFGWDAVAQQRVVAEVREKAGFGRGRDFFLHVKRHDNFANGLADFHELRSSSRRVYFQFSPLGPMVGVVVVIDVAEQEVGVGLVDDQPDVAAHAHRPEVLVPRPIQLVQTQARLRRVQLQVEGRGFHRFLLVVGQAGQAVGEGIGDAEVHLFNG